MDYSAEVEKRREQNHQFLRTLGILSSSHAALKQSRPSVIRSKPLKRLQKSPAPTRMSCRLLGKEPKKYSEIFSAIEKDTSSCSATEIVKRKNSYGAIEGVPVGTEFGTRLEASHAGIHRPTVAGIHGDTEFGCYSLALSGGYAEDVDLGDSFIYTGEGGRDLKGTKANPKNLRTAPQSKDQVLERGNLALSRNVENKNPVRVLRGYKLRGKFAPTEGYRYDGLYRVVKFYLASGVAGFKVYKFLLERIEGQDSPPWSDILLRDESLEFKDEEAFNDN